MGDRLADPSALQPHPKRHLLPDLSEEEFALLRADIEKNGVVQPIICSEDVILDGHHRWRVCRELGIEVPHIRLTARTEDEEIELLLGLNTHRRQLTRAQKREAIRAVLDTFPERSDRWIAEMVGSTHPTVGAVRKQMKDEGALENLSNRETTDGRSYPSDRSAPEPEPEEDTDDPFASLLTPEQRDAETLAEKRARQRAEIAEQKDTKVVDISSRREKDTRTQDEWVRDEKKDVVEEVEESPYGRVLGFVAHVIEEPESFTDEEIIEAVRHPEFPRHWIRAARHVHETLGRIIATTPEADEGDDHVSAH